ncbi:hypothetical protein NSTC745_06313 [Nostoc sp. DSM 114161]|jgi:hypothetical protein|uniref:hypothetical protein n=1 Tax=Nostoc sp. DSM 114161 TaxID=3440143 RepID=UPI004046814F
MHQNEIRIKFKTDDESDLLTLIRLKADGEGISVEEYAINALKKYVEASAPSPPPNPTLSTGQMNEIRRRIGNVDASCRGEIASLRRKIDVLAEAIASIQSQLDSTT